MTPLPKHLEEMRQFWIDKEQDIEIDDDENFYGYALLNHPRQGPLIWQSSLIHVIEKSSVDLMLKDMESMARALEEIEKTPPNTDTEIQMQVCAFRALKIWREKYKPEGL